jgi:hypothetical protein
MRTPRSTAIAGLMGMALCVGLAPAPASAARSCITNLAGDVCLAQCIGTLQQECGSDVECHQGVAAALQALASASDESEACAAALAVAVAACDCPRN